MIYKHSEFKMKRDAEQQAQRKLNREKKGGSMSARQHSRQYKSGCKCGIKGMKGSNMTSLGAGIAAAQANRQATPQRLAIHKAYMDRIAYRRSGATPF